MTRTKSLAFAGALVASLALGACGAPGSALSSAPPSPASSAAPAGEAHDDADVTFASMMVPHHDQAIAMSTMLLAKGGIDPKVTALARSIMTAQAPEVAQMSGWLARWGAGPSPSSMPGAGMDQGDGMMSESDMEALEQATGTEASRLFLTGMIRHHQGAVIMAQAELDAGQNAEATELAQQIVTAQKSEIIEMNQLIDAK